MDSLLTINKLGFAEGKGGNFYLSSETGDVLLHVQPFDQRELVSRIILHSTDPVKDQAYLINISYPDPGIVTLSWNSPKKDNSLQQVTFVEIDLIQFIDVDSVRAYVLSRQSG